MVDFQFKDKNRFANYKEILSEIRAFTSCPELLKPIDEVQNVSDEQIDLEDDDEELTKQLNSKLFNVLVGSGSSICDSESLISDEFSSIFSSEEEGEDEFDKIVEQLQNKSNEDHEETKSSMPTLSSLFNIQLTTNSSELQPIKTINRDKNKINGKKVKFIQHQSKIRYNFTNESLRLFDKIIKNNFHRKAKASGLINCKFNNCDLNEDSNQNCDSNESSNQNCDSNESSNQISFQTDQPASINHEIELSIPNKKPDKESNSTAQAVNERAISKRTQNKLSIKEIRKKSKNNSNKNVKKSKSEIFTLKPTSNSSTLKSLLNSIKSK